MTRGGGGAAVVVRLECQESVRGMLEMKRLCVAGPRLVSASQTRDTLELPCDPELCLSATVSKHGTPFFDVRLCRSGR